MDYFVEAIESGDYCSLMVFSAVAVMVGDRMVSRQPTMRVWGLRLAGIAFVGFAAMHVVDAKDITPSDLAMGAVVGLLGAMTTLGPAWILLSATGFLGGFYRKAEASSKSAAHRRRLRREQKEAEQRRRHEQIEWERSAPEGERALREEAERKKLAENRSTESQKRRSDTRADCEMLYQLYAVNIGSRFPRESLEEWINKYMGDDQSAEYVEERGEQLRRIILHHKEQIQPTPKFNSLRELAAWVSEQESEIQSLPIEESVRQVLLVNLRIKRSELTEKLMDEL